MAQSEDEQRAARRKQQSENKEYYAAKRKAFMQANPQKQLEYGRAYYQKHKAEVDARRRVYIRERLKRERSETLALLGGKCALCGYSDFRALHIDHVENDGNAERKKWRWTLTYYKAIRASCSVEESRYQLLCANCHEIKHDQDKA